MTRACRLTGREFLSVKRSYFGAVIFESGSTTVELGHFVDRGFRQNTHHGESFSGYLSRHWGCEIQQVESLC